ncbi:MAG TPA: glycosyltransferase family 39 protein [Patescibacteria group bacterium]|nr:glycosyltransferase family 39 protein [Patescibacteria group bacterium]
MFQNSNLKRFKITPEIFFVLALIIICLIFSTYKLTESPGVWADEGVFLQTARNLISFGQQGLQVEPGKITSSEYLTAGYPFIYPISLVFKIFGEGVLEARLVMVLFILFFIFTAHYLIKRMFGFSLAAQASLVLVSFPVLYGNGKSAIGEVPGLLYLIVFLFFFFKIEQSAYKKKLYYILAGLFLGLAVITKPIFLIILPAVLIAILFLRKRTRFYPKLILTSLASFLIPIIIWPATQFKKGDSVINILSFYANPHGLGDLSGTVLGNLNRFITELSPLYFLLLLLLWAFSVIIRIREKRPVFVAEISAFTFSVMILPAYLTTMGFYRYFFPALALALLFFPSSLCIFLNYLNGKLKRLKSSTVTAISFLLVLSMIIINLYQLGFSSYVAGYYQSARTAALESYFENFDPAKTIFFYKVPEAVIFLPNHNYFQYARLTPIVFAGQDQLEKIAQGIPDEIMFNNNDLKEIEDKISLYKFKQNIDRYIVIEKIR